MRLLTVDIGTNTVLALVSERRGDRLVAVRDQMEIVRLGEGLDRTGRLSPAAIDRTVAVLAGVAESAGPVDQRAAIATEAVRKAANSEEFLARARAALGFHVEVIDGHRE